MLTTLLALFFPPQARSHKRAPDQCQRFPGTRPPLKTTMAPPRVHPAPHRARPLLEAEARGTVQKSVRPSSGRSPDRAHRLPKGDVRVWNRASGVRIHSMCGACRVAMRPRKCTIHELSSPTIANPAGPGTTATRGRRRPAGRGAGGVPKDGSPAAPPGPSAPGGQ